MRRDTQAVHMWRNRCHDPLIKSFRVECYELLRYNHLHEREGTIGFCDHIMSSTNMTLFCSLLVLTYMFAKIDASKSCSLKAVSRMDSGQFIGLTEDGANLVLLDTNGTSESLANLLKSERVLPLDQMRCVIRGNETMNKNFPQVVQKVLCLSFRRHKTLIIWHRSIFFIWSEACGAKTTQAVWFTWYLTTHWYAIWIWRKEQEYTWRHCSGQPSRSPKPLPSSTPGSFEIKRICCNRWWRWWLLLYCWTLTGTPCIAALDRHW